MTDNERILEWCGVVQVRGTKGEWRFEEFRATNYWWEVPNGRRYLDRPSIDPNFLFEYAKQELKKRGYRFTIRFDETFLVRIYRERYDCIAVDEDKDLVKAFKSALVKVIDKEK